MTRPVAHSVVIRRVSTTCYEVFVGGKSVGLGNNIHAAQRLADRHVPGIRWTRPSGHDGHWNGRTPAAGEAA